MPLKPARYLVSLGSILAPSCLLVALCAAPTFAVTVPTVPVGNAGNAADTTYYGAVSYDYRIGTTEVTNAQYAAFLNAKAASDPLALYNPSMGSGYGGITRGGSDGSYTYATIAGRENMPVNYVTWYDAIRFANWLHNGQGSGDTETGAYTLPNRLPSPIGGLSITRNPGATWFLTSEDEWYKAAYHKNDGTTANYFNYPTASNPHPVAEAPPGGSNSANYNNAVGDLTIAGAYTASASPYGTFDQGGNVFEWNEALVSGSYRGLRGGAFNGSPYLNRLEARGSAIPAIDHAAIGFRVATIVPEPSTVYLAAFGIAALAAHALARLRFHFCAFRWRAASGLARSRFRPCAAFLALSAWR